MKIIVPGLLCVILTMFGWRGNPPATANNNVNKSIDTSEVVHLVSEDRLKLYAAIAQKESNHNDLAVSKAGAIGRMQVMPGTALDHCGIKDKELLKISDVNYRCGITVFEDYLIKAGGNIKKALSFYNCGPYQKDEKKLKQCENYALDVLKIKKEMYNG